MDQSVDELRGKVKKGFAKNFFSAMDVLKRDIDTFDDRFSPIVKIYKGYCSWYYGDRKKASTYFIDAREGVKKRGCKLDHFELGVNTYYPTINDSEKFTHIKEFEFFNRPAVPNNYSVVVSSDSKYFKLFGKAFINVFLSHSNNNLHVHIVDPDDFCMSFFERRAGGRLSFSFEKSGNSSYPAYCATARFLILKSVIEKTGKPLLVLDIDAVVVRDIDHKIKSLLTCNNSVCVAKMHNSWMPWNTYLCGNVLFKNDQESLSIIESFSNYYSYCCKLNGLENSWFVDQNSLYYSISRINHKVGDIKKYGLIFYGTRGFDKSEFSKIMSLYEKSISFDGCYSGSKESFLETLNSVLPHKDVAYCLLDAFYKSKS